MVLESPLDAVLLDLKELSSLVIRSFSYLNRVTVISVVLDEVDLIELFSISSILRLKTSIYLSLSLNAL